MCTGIGRLRTNSNCLRITSASSNIFAKAVTLAESTERATRLDLYDFYETDIVLWLLSVKKSIRPICDDK